MTAASSTETRLFTGEPDTLDVEHATGLAGLDQLRSSQQRCIDALLAGRDAVAVMPTGSGKSAIYQIAATIIHGPTLVVTPLLALVQDQQRSIAETELPPAMALDGNSSRSERSDVLAALTKGATEFCFVTPEILADEEFVSRLAAIEVSLLVIDEAHCMVSWGHSFRPNYLALGDVRRGLGAPVTLALTASADPRVRDDLVRMLSMTDPLVHVDQLGRFNIELDLRTSEDRSAARRELVSYFAEDDRKAIIYAARRKDCESLAEDLRSTGRHAFAFHGGLRTIEKAERAESFRNDDGAVVVATTAFGMGVDIPDVAVVAHLDFPPTLVDYYQEIGRAGRDGEDARAVAFVGRRHRSRRAFAGGVRKVDVDDCARVIGAMAAGATSRRALVEKSSLTMGRVSRALTVLEMAEAVRSVPRLQLLDASVSEERITELCEQRENFDRSQIAAVERYLSSSDCRWGQILAALGEAIDPCRKCDNCETAGPQSTNPMVGRRVAHRKFGDGVVTGVSENDATIAFDQVGPRTLDLDLCLDQEIITLG